MEKDEISLKNCRLYPLGAYCTDSGIRFSFTADTSKKCGVLLYPDDRTEPIAVEFPDWARHGRVCAAEVCVSHAAGSIKYLFFCGENIFKDPYMTDSSGFGGFGEKTSSFSAIAPCGRHTPHTHVSIPFADSIFYMLNVRGFTAHSSSRIKEKGTFKGVMAKLPYLKELGVTSLIFMPLYEFDEVIHISGEDAFSSGTAENVNFWGYSDGFYYVPKHAFSYSGDAVSEMHELVDAVHARKMEAILQFWFPERMGSREITDVLRFWHLNYGIDGFELIGGGLPFEEILADPVLYGCKMIFDGKIESKGDANPIHGYMNSSYMVNMRQFLKGDPNSAQEAAFGMRNADPVGNPVNYIARQDTMRLADIVSYNEKHNEANGEHGRDGADYNFSWNCGYEGSTRRKSICELRARQMKNALAMVILGQGAPLLYSGDEFGNTQFGNNNPYNQDNETGYIKWPSGSSGRNLAEYTRALIRIRKDHASLGSPRTLTGRDYLSYGFPDVSMHGEELWRSDLGPTSHCFGMLYSDRYFDPDTRSLIYLIFNMHWEDRTVAIPKLKRGRWKIRLTSDEENVLNDVKNITVRPRSVVVLETIEQQDGT